MKVSVTVMAHPKRTDWATDLASKLDCGITWDNSNNVWDTARRSWLSYDKSATHHLVIQDDALVCLDFLDAAQNAAAMAPNWPICFSAIEYKVSKQFYRRAMANGDTWYPVSGRGVSAVSLMIPTRMIGGMLEGCQDIDTEHDDVRISQYFKRRGTPVLLSVPSLVDHRKSESLVGNTQHRNRGVLGFIGQDTSGLSIEWQSVSDPVVPVRLDRQVKQYRTR